MSIVLTEQERAQFLSSCKTQSQIDFVLSDFERPIESIICVYAFKKKTPKWPTQILIYYVGKVDNRWWKKINSCKHIATRPGTRDECIDDHFRMRYKFSSYKNYEDLIEDEIRCGTDPLFIETIKEFQKKNPII